MKALLGHEREESSTEGLNQVIDGHKMNLHDKKGLYELAQSKVQSKKHSIHNK